MGPRLGWTGLPARLPAWRDQQSRETRCSASTATSWMEPEVGWTLHARSWTERGLGGGWVAAELPPLRTGIESL